MKKILLIITLIFDIVCISNSQNPITLSAGSDTTICLGTSATLNATVTDTIIRETTSYTLTNIPFGNYPLNNGTLCANPFSDDHYYGSFPIGFNFCFYGQTYNEFWVGSNGWVAFQNLNNPPVDPWTLSMAQAIPNPDPSRPRAAIMACYRDWYPNGNNPPGQYRYQTIGTSPNRKCIISFFNVPLYSCTSIRGSFQVVLHEWTNYIDINMINVPTCPTWNSGLGIQGIQNAPGTQALAVPGRNVTTWTAQNESKRFKPNGPIIPVNIQWYLASSTTPFASGNNVSVSPTVSTNYVVKASVCSNTITDPVTVNVEPCGELSTSSTVSLCYGGNTGTATVTITGGIPPYTYIWSNGMGTSMTNDSVNTITNLTAGTYYVTVSTLSGAYILYSSVVVGQNPELFSSSSTLPETCPGASDGTIIVTCNQVPPQGPFTYFCSNSTNSLPTNSQLYQFHNLVTGNYTVTVYDVFGCPSTSTSTINQLSLSFNTFSSPISCHGDTNAYASINVSGGTPPYYYSWSTGSTLQGINNLGAGNYSVTATDQNGCQIFTNFEFEEPEAIVIYSSGDQNICLSNSANIVTAVIGGTQPYTYYWNPGGYSSGNIVVSPNESTQYCVYVVDANGCISNNRCASVIVNPPLYMNLEISPDSICTGDTVTINANMGGGNGGPYFYQLYNGPIVSMPYRTVEYSNTLSVIKYIIIGKDGCGTPSVSDTVEVVVVPTNDINIVIDKSSGCSPLTVNFSEITINSGQSYLWDFGDGSYFNYSYSKSPSHVFINPGYYDVGLTVYNILGCSVDTLISNMILVYEVPESNFSVNGRIVFDYFPYVEFQNNSIGGHNYYWNFGDGDSLLIENPYSHLYPGIGNYIVSLIAESYYGCRDTSYQSVEVRKLNSFYTPSAFNPYSSISENRIFRPITNMSEKISKYELFIYNRWGELIFRSESIDNGWDGTYKGIIVPNGIYTWIIKYDGPDDNGTIRYGEVFVTY